MKSPITFFGSGPVAAKSLGLVAKDFDIEAVITKPRPPHHKGDVPVIELAEKLKLPILTAADKKELDKLFDSKPVKSQLAILIDFGIIISQEVIDYFPKGIINSHFSVLPQWRGADPITFAVLSGQKQTGVSLMLLVAKMDEGPLLAYGEYDIRAEATTPELTDELINLSHALLVENVPKYLASELQPVPQSVTGRDVSYSHKLTKTDGHIDFKKPAEQLEREVRAYTGWPRSQAKLFDKDVIITSARVAKNADDGNLVIKCNPGWLEIKELIAPSGRKMSGADFLRGYKNR